MKALSPDEALLGALRAIARADFDIEAAKRIGAAAGWELAGEEPGFVRYGVDPAGRREQGHLLSVCRRPEDRGPFAFVTLFFFEEGRDEELEDIDRAPFDRAYRRLAKKLSGLLGPPSRSGKYDYPHNDGWPYLYSWWRLEDCGVALVQDEFDIQFGMDVSLWVLPAGTEITLPVSGD